MKLVWIDGSHNEHDWISWLLRDLPLEQSVHKGWPRPAPNTIYVLDSNWHPLASIPSSVLLDISRLPGVGLIHLSDEWFNEDYSIYSNFSFVIRTYLYRPIRSPALMQIPLGFPVRKSAKPLFLPASERKYLWMFYGAPLRTRQNMLKILETVPNGFSYNPKKPSRLTPENYTINLSNSVFAPAPMGNVLLETWRLYEALELGTIPILEKRIFVDYFKELFGDHPIPTFQNWEMAVSFLHRVRSDSAASDSIQNEVVTWWSKKKIELSEKVQNYVIDGFSGLHAEQLRTSLLSSKSRRLFHQYVELICHQSMPSARDRIIKSLRRGHFRRDLSHLNSND